MPFSTFRASFLKDTMLRKQNKTNSILDFFEMHKNKTSSQTEAVLNTKKFYRMCTVNIGAMYFASLLRNGIDDIYKNEINQ